MRRLVTLLGLALSGLMLVACTSGSSAVNQGSPGTSGSTAARPTLAPACVTGLGDLYTALTAIDDHIAGGMTLAAYSQAVASAALALNRVSSDQLDSHCVGHGYTPLKTAFGIYADASGTWTNCAQTDWLLDERHRVRTRPAMAAGPRADRQGQARLAR